MPGRCHTPLALLLSAALASSGGALAAEPAVPNGTAPAEAESPVAPVAAEPGPQSGSRQADGDFEASPSSAALEQARRHFETALDRYSRGRYRDAIQELERARALDPSGKDLVYNLALVHEKLGELEPALAYFRQYLQMESDSDERARIEASIVRLNGALEQERLQAVEPERVAASRRHSGKARLQPGHADAWVWAAGGVSIAALLTGVVLGIRALVLRPGSHDATGGSRSVDDYRADEHTAHRSAVAADIAFAVSLTTGAGATLLYFGRTPPTPREDLTGQRLWELARPSAGLDIGVGF